MLTPPPTSAGSQQHRMALAFQLLPMMHGVHLSAAGLAGADNYGNGDEDDNSEQSGISGTVCGGIGGAQTVFPGGCWDFYLLYPLPTTVKSYSVLSLYKSHSLMQPSANLDLIQYLDSLHHSVMK